MCVYGGVSKNKGGVEIKRERKRGREREGEKEERGRRLDGMKV